MWARPWSTYYGNTSLYLKDVLLTLCVRLQNTRDWNVNPHNEPEKVCLAAVLT